MNFREHHRLYEGFFQELCPEADNSIDVYYDQAVMDADPANEDRQIAMLLEPRSMIGDAYEYVFRHPDYFRYIFTHDSRILRFQNAYEVNWGNVWLTTDSWKTKGISICTSNKNWCPLHNLRRQIANYYQNRPEVDVFVGDWNNNVIEAKDYLERYRYSIVVENDIDEYWYTEKILNCFSTKTVPIYIGATGIENRFNENGIIRARGFRDVTDIVASLDIREDYESRKEAIEENFYRVVPYKISWKDRFLHRYSGMLEGMLK